jgi:hypothetical protein
MAVTAIDGRIIRFTADDDVYVSGLQSLRVLGVRLSTVAADGTATLRKNDSNGAVIMQLAALAKTCDESCIPFDVEGGTLHVDLSGAAAEVIVYLE